MDKNSLIELSAVEATAAMRAGEVRAEDYAGALLNQAQRLERLNAFRTLDAASVLEAARAADEARLAGSALGAMHGLPIPVKDSVNTSGMPTSNGTRALRDFRPGEDAAILKPLFAQGAFLMGKTNIHELSRGWTSNNAAFGAVRNPYDVRHSPGGSSGGSGAAVAARIAPLAVAEDTLGSIRVPASMCGIAGLRPTFGRYPGEGVMSLSLAKFDQVGPLARTVADLALFDTVITGDASPLSARDLHGARIGISPDFLLDGLDPEVERITTEVLAKLSDAGAHIVPAALPVEAMQALATVTTIIACENVTSISSFLDEQRTGISFQELLAQAGPVLQAIYRSGVVPSREEYESALRQRARLSVSINAHFRTQGIAALAFPPILSPAPRLFDDLDNNLGDPSEFELRGEKVSIRTVMGRNTALGSAGGLCSLIIPGGLTASGLPIGIEFAALPGQDRALLSLGLSIERALGPIPPPA